MNKFIHILLNIFLFPFSIIIFFSLINYIDVEKYDTKKLEEIMKEVLFKWKNFFVDY